MKSVSRLVIAAHSLLLLIAGCTEPPIRDLTTLPKGSAPAAGLEFSELIDTVDLAGVETHWLPQKQSPTILLVSIDPTLQHPLLSAAPLEGRSASEAVQADGLSVLLGSGYTAHAQSLEPVGLLQVEGRQLSPLAPYGYTRIVGFSGSAMAVVHRASYQPELFPNAIQVGPGIIEAGQLDISEKDLERPRYYRSFTALCAERWLVGVTLEPSHLRTLGIELLAKFEQMNWQCSEVVNFAGDRQALLVINTTERLIYHGDITSAKTSFLGFKPHSPGLSDD